MGTQWRLCIDAFADISGDLSALSKKKKTLAHSRVYETPIPFLISIALRHQDPLTLGPVLEGKYVLFKASSHKAY